MMILRRKADNIVTHINVDPAMFSSLGLYHSGSLNRSLTPDTAEIVEVESIPALWSGGYYTYEADWVPTAKGNEAIAAAQLAQSAQAVIADVKGSIDHDAVVNALKTKTAEEIEAYIAGLFSALSGLSDVEINAYVDANVTDLASARSALKVLAKDTAAIVRLLKVISKISIYLAKQAV